MACGRLDFFWEFGLKPWDVAGGSILVQEAGGRVSDLAGNDVRSGDGTVLASNGHLHDALLELVRHVPHARDYQALKAARPG